VNGSHQSSKLAYSTRTANSVSSTSWRPAARGQGDVELGIGKGQFLRGGTSHIDARVALTSRDHKGLRGVDCGDRLGA
jgi:hypothetical protein